MVTFDLLAAGLAGLKLYVHAIPLAGAYSNLKATVLVGFLVFCVYHVELDLMLFAAATRKVTLGSVGNRVVEDNKGTRGGAPVSLPNNGQNSF